MMNLSYINVLDADLNRIGTLDTWISLVWDEDYRDTGRFQIEVWLNDSMSALLKEDVFCSIPQSQTLAIIKSVSIKKQKLVCAGYMAVCVLDERVGTRQVMGENAEDAMRAVVSEMTPYPHVVLGEKKGYAEKFEAELRDTSVLEYEQTISEAADIGYMLRFDKTNKQLVFECYKPTANINARYATAYGNLGDIEFSSSVLDFRNVAVVVNTYSETIGEGDAKETVENRKIFYVGATDKTGSERKEMIVTTSIAPEEGESKEDFHARIKAEGETALIEQAKIENIKFEVDDERTQLGDVITVLLPELNTNLTVRVIGVQLTCQRNKTTREISVGTPITRERRK